MLSRFGARLQVQRRIDAAVAGIHYTPSLRTYAVDLQERLQGANGSGGLEGVSRALDEFESMFVTEDPIRARYALLTFLVNNPQLGDMGLELPRKPANLTT
jgi:hypothetical protein